MFPFLNISRLALLLAIALSTTAELAADVGDMDPHLPEKAVLETMRFQAFTRKAQDKKQWEKRHSELLGLLDKELEKASVSNTRAAGSLRTLIKDLQEAKYVQPKKDSSKLAGEYPVLADGNQVMVKQDFHIKKAEDRVLTYPFEIKRVPAMIKIGLGGGSDDSADRGIRFMLVDPVGRVIQRGFSDTDDYVWIEKQCTRKGTWKFILEDLDTDLKDKRSPGNRGSVEVLVKAE